jgi:hypothetical protein
MDEIQINQLITRPNESLGLELKNWFDPDSFAGRAKLIKAIVALRNNDGGYLLIGFNNSDGTPNVADAPDDAQTLFHVDKLTAMVTKVASSPFEIFVHYPAIDGKRFVVVEVPPGVKTPVITKSELKEGSNIYVKMNCTYVRTLKSNHTPSTAEASWKDWPELIERCFENREADVGRFVRRHLASAMTGDMKDVLGHYLSASRPPSAADQLLQFLDESFARYQARIEERAHEDLPEHGSMEFAASIDGEILEYRANQDFLNLIQSTNPKWTGWSAFSIMTNSEFPTFKPRVVDGAWEALVDIFGTGFLDDLTFWRACPDGKFYTYHGFEDDFSNGDRTPEPGTALEFVLAILRAAECLALSLYFAKAMGATDEGVLKIMYRWRGINGRTLSSWASPRRMMPPWYSAVQDEVVSTLDVPIETAPAALGGYVYQATAPLFEAFDGFSLKSETVEDIVSRLINRQL